MGMDGCNGNFLADVRGEGWGWAHGDFPASTNPYPKGGAHYAAWLAGWQACIDGKTYTETVSPIPSQDTPT